MTLLGQAALAMWWDIAPEVRADFEHWHAHEHFPERLAVEGFLRATRWREAGGLEAMFVLYELAGHGVLSSPAYAARLNAPSPWSARLMPHHRNMVRSQCRVLASHGAVTAAFVETMRLPALPDGHERLLAAFEPLAASIAGRPGVAGLHLLGHDAPALAATTEQRLRGLADGTAALVLVAAGYDAAALAAFCDEVLTARATIGHKRQRFELALSAVPADMA